MTGRRGRRRKQVVDDFKEMRRYWKLNAKALDRTMWGTRFGRGYGPVFSQISARWILQSKHNISPYLPWAHRAQFWALKGAVNCQQHRLPAVACSNAACCDSHSVFYGNCLFNVCFEDRHFGYSCRDKKRSTEIVFMKQWTCTHISWSWALITKISTYQLTLKLPPVACQTTLRYVYVVSSNKLARSSLTKHWSKSKYNFLTKLENSDLQTFR
jgi:hypothetical protein